MLSEDDVDFDDEQLAAVAFSAASTTEAEKGELRELTAKILDARAQITVLEALQTEAMARAATIAAAQSDRTGQVKSSEREMPLRSIAAELAAALRVSPRAMQSQLKDAEDLVRRFPETFAAWQAGQITRRHAMVVQEAGRFIDDVDAREHFERMAVRAARVESPGRLGPIVKTLAARFDAKSADERHRLARETRGVRVFDLADGMSELHLIQSSTLIHGIHERITEQAHTIIRARTRGDAQPVADVDPAAEAPDERPLDAVRADLVADMLLCGTPVVTATAPARAWAPSKRRCASRCRCSPQPERATTRPCSTGTGRWMSTPPGSSWAAHRSGNG